MTPHAAKRSVRFGDAVGSGAAECGMPVRAEAQVAGVELALGEMAVGETALVEGAAGHAEGSAPLKAPPPLEERLSLDA
eukprot:CAMPEP_0181232288 /NCGR_PEP_ID=MMETSP1096-20121128/35641_1 /TAXON_ID=156174 ORGANISM="Chrysochromulina ericina, Strain CCMP281" /NCGR_SAMPLE_ID=MMETSP1096 /ASSEMBLY_ACC=CAM_ASM_000453 /LENGTH=78 /DNA_ID=CAMNT_0023326549 /DNA_START=120 /DNA_END=356 /DNA_ORIENTATION=-